MCAPPKQDPHGHLHQLDQVEYPFETCPFFQVIFIAASERYGTEKAISPRRLQKDSCTLYKYALSRGSDRRWASVSRPSFKIPTCAMPIPWSRFSVSNDSPDCSTSEIISFCPVKHSLTALRPLIGDTAGDDATSVDIIMTFPSDAESELSSIQSHLRGLVVLFSPFTRITICHALLLSNTQWHPISNGIVSCIATCEQMSWIWTNGKIWNQRCPKYRHIDHTIFTTQRSLVTIIKW